MKSKKAKTYSLMDSFRDKKEFLDATGRTEESNLISNLSEYFGYFMDIKTYLEHKDYEKISTLLNKMKKEEDLNKETSYRNLFIRCCDKKTYYFLKYYYSETGFYEELENKIYSLLMFSAYLSIDIKNKKYESREKMILFLDLLLTRDDKKYKEVNYADWY